MTQFKLLCSDVASATDVGFVVPHRVLLKNVNAFSAHQLYSLYVDTKYAKCNVEVGILAKFLAHSSTLLRCVLPRGDTRGDAWWRTLKRLTKIAQ